MNNHLLPIVWLFFFVASVFLLEYQQQTGATPWEQQQKLSSGVGFISQIDFVSRHLLQKLKSKIWHIFCRVHLLWLYQTLTETSNLKTSCVTEFYQAVRCMLFQPDLTLCMS